MTYAKGSVVVDGEGAVDWCAGVVVPDGCGEGQDALQDPDEHAGGGVAAVSFEGRAGL
jgi:hypothetical protein